jgi:hypothetical protein
MTERMLGSQNALLCSLVEGLWSDWLIPKLSGVSETIEIEILQIPFENQANFASLVRLGC